MDVGFLSIGFWDILDILIVGYLLFLVYRLLRGSLAFNIFIGMALLYGAWLLVRILEMELLSTILGQFFNIGLIILIIIFQPEVRRFLLVLGDSTYGKRAAFFENLNLLTKKRKVLDVSGQTIIEVVKALSESKTGALIVIAYPRHLDLFIHSGIELEAKLSKELLVGIFQKDSPLHDGAVIICNNRIIRASVILPLSEREELPSHWGLRHRAGLGVSEQFGVNAIIISEETGEIAFASKAEMRITNLTELAKRLVE